MQLSVDFIMHILKTLDNIYGVVIAHNSYLMPHSKTQKEANKQLDQTTIGRKFLQAAIDAGDHTIVDPTMFLIKKHQPRPW